MEKYKKLKELSNAELLRNEGKFLEALEIIKRIEKKEGLIPQDQLSIHVLKCTLLNKLGFYEDALRLAEKTYKEADKLGNLPKLIDVSIGMAEDLMFLLRFNESLEVIAKCEKIHKEKKICLVCRGGVLRFSYICECGAMYCENCARALTNLENVCWACDVPIDYSKPVKSYKEKDEITKVDKKQRKNKEN